MCAVGYTCGMRFYYAGIRRALVYVRCRQYIQYEVSLCRHLFFMYYWLYLQYEVSLCWHLVWRTLLAIHTAWGSCCLPAPREIAWPGRPCHYLAEETREGLAGVWRWDRYTDWLSLALYRPDSTPPPPLPPPPPHATTRLAAQSAICRV